MKPTLLLAATLYTLGGLLPGIVGLAMGAALHAARSPDRLLDALWVAAFHLVGYLAG